MTLLRLDAITIGDRFRKDLGDMDALVASIESVGLLHPIVVMADDASHVTLVAGERRLRACERLGWERIPVRMLPAGVDLLRAERDENEVREPFTRRPGPADPEEGGMKRLLGIAAAAVTCGLFVGLMWALLPFAVGSGR